MAIYDLILGMFPPSALSVGAFHSGSCSCYQLISHRYVSIYIYLFVYIIYLSCHSRLTTNAKATAGSHSLMYLSPSFMWRGVPFIGHPLVSRGKYRQRAQDGGGARRLIVPYFQGDDSNDASLCQYGRFWFHKPPQICSQGQPSVLLDIHCHWLFWLDLSCIRQWIYDKVKREISPFQDTVNSSREYREKIQGFVMAMANSWGLFLVIMFMGYGLVAVPRRLWFTGNPQKHLNQLYGNASRVKEECMDSELEFIEVCKASITLLQYKSWTDILIYDVQ